MAIEREWRFVVLSSPRPPRRGSRRIEQGYLHADEQSSIRVRVDSHGGAAITIKVAGRGDRRRAGPRSREEYEYAIPLADARRLLRATDERVVKRRHRIGRIELDVFEGALRGLVLAEVEVDGRSRKAPAAPPGWEWRDVSGDERYGNPSLARHGRPRGAPRAVLGAAERRSSGSRRRN